jgi:hypothetical protein
MWNRNRNDFGRLDPDPEGQKWPTKIKKSEEIQDVGSLLMAKGFSCSLDVLHGG